jgi:hypothetical protein
MEAATPGTSGQPGTSDRDRRCTARGVLFVPMVGASCLRGRASLRGQLKAQGAKAGTEHEFEGGNDV